MDFSRFILLPEALPADAPIGGKALALARLSAAGFAVPPWLVISSDVLPLSDAHLPPPAAFVVALEQAVAARFGSGGAFAVRSSAREEDGARLSFAGQFESFLHVPPEEIAARVADVWRSALGERVLAYRREHGAPAATSLPGVIVQRMVASSCAGAAFGIDPVSGRRDIAVVAAVPGLADKLMHGETAADHWEIDRSGAVLSRRLCSPDTPALDEPSACAVAALARRCGEVFGCPQDIEWALARDGQLWLLQSRPITGLDRLPEADGPFALWDNSNIAESYGGVTTPLTFSFARRAYESVYREFCALMGVPARRISTHAETFRRMLGLIHGRVYYNLLNWYRVLALLPGYRTNRRFMEGMMGVKAALPPEALAELAADPTNQAPASFLARLRDRLALGGTLLGLLWNHWRFPSRKAAFLARLHEALQPPSPPLPEQRLDELAAYYRQLESRLITRWDAPLVNDFFAMIHFGVMRKLATAWCADTDGSLANALLAGAGGIISVEPARRVRELARLLAEAPALAATLRAGSVAEITAALSAQPGIRAAFAEYLDLFGDRCLEELKLETPTLHDDPLMLYRAAGRLAEQSKPVAPADPPAAAPASAEARVAAALRPHPLRRWVFRRILRLARDRVRDRENLRFERTRVFGRTRRIFVEFGRRLHTAGRLADPRDVFYLTLDEVLGFVDGTAAGADLRALAAARCAEFGQYRHEPPPPDRFSTCGAVHLDGRFATGDNSTAPTDDSGDTRSGLGCCAGTVRGRANVILDPRQARVLAGDILVAARTDPGWVLLFPGAAGLAVEHGSLLSHSAIVARELRLPAVVGIPGLTSWLRTGDLLELDGAKGCVRRLAPAPGAPP